MGLTSVRREQIIRAAVRLPSQPSRLYGVIAPKARFVVFGAAPLAPCGAPRQIYAKETSS
jgi:hypothetical protein